MIAHFEKSFTASSFWKKHHMSGVIYGHLFRFSETEPVWSTIFDINWKWTSRNRKWHICINAYIYKRRICNRWILETYFETDIKSCNRHLNGLFSIAHHQIIETCYEISAKKYFFTFAKQIIFETLGSLCQTVTLSNKCWFPWLYLIIILSNTFHQYSLTREPLKSKSCPTASSELQISSWEFNARVPKTELGL